LGRFLTVDTATLPAQQSFTASVLTMGRHFAMAARFTAPQR
jgi:hypothetical protein